MNNCLTSQELELYGSELVKAAEVLINSFCCNDVYQALILAADILRESFQSLATACLQADRTRPAPIRSIFFVNVKPGKAQTALFINRHYVPP